MEFARISQDGRLTLVINLGSDDQLTYWALSEFTALDAARSNLRERESARLADIHYLLRNGQVEETAPDSPMTRYLRVRVETGIPWPTKETVVRFRDRDLTLYPETDELPPTVLLAYDDTKMTSDQALQLVRRFLSSLSWAEGRRVQDLEYLDGTHRSGSARVDRITATF